MRRRSRTGLVIAALVAAALLVSGLAPLAQAAPTRPEFVAQAEVICKTTLDQYKQKAIKQSKKLAKTLRKSKQFRKGGDSDDVPLNSPQGKKFFKLFSKVVAKQVQFQGQAIHEIDRQLAPLPEPVGDEPTIAAWLQARYTVAERFKAAAQSIRKHKSEGKPSPKRLLVLILRAAALTDEGAKSDQIVGAFGFRKCLVAPESEATL